MASVVAPVLHTYDVPPEAVRVAEAPSQRMPSLEVVPEFSTTLMAAVGSGLTVMVVAAAAAQLLALVTVTV